MEVYRGDIFYIEDNYRTEGSEQRPGRPALVVSNDTGNYHSDIVSIVWLTTAEKKPLPTHCKVLSRTLSTAICEQVVTISQNRLGEYIRTASEAEMKEVDRCLMIALGLGQIPDQTEAVENAVVADLNAQNERLLMKLEGAERKLDELNAENAGLVLENGDLKEYVEKQKNEVEHLKNFLGNQPANDYDPDEVIVLKTERDLYKQQYEKMLERLIGA